MTQDFVWASKMYLPVFVSIAPDCNRYSLFCQWLFFLVRRVAFPAQAFVFLLAGRFPRTQEFKPALITFVDVPQRVSHTNTPLFQALSSGCRRIDRNGLPSGAIGLNMLTDLPVMSKHRYPLPIITLFFIALVVEVDLIFAEQASASQEGIEVKVVALELAEAPPVGTEPSAGTTQVQKPSQQISSPSLLESP